MKKQDILERGVNTVFLSIGTNLGNKKFNIEKIKSLIESKKIKIVASSSLYSTPSWPNPNYPEYINIVVKIKTQMSLKKLFIFTKNIEKKMGRKIKIRNHPRICDIDIIDFNKENVCLNVNTNQLIIPHPRMHLRNFVLFPLFEVQSDWIHPKFNKKISNLLKNMSYNDITTIKLI